VTAVTAAMVLAGAGAVRAEEAHIYIAPHAWFADLSDGADFDRDVHPGFDFLARLGRHRIVAGATSGENESDAANADVELKRARGFYGFSFVNTSLLDIGFLVGADTYDVTVKAGGSEVSVDSPAPAVGLSLGIRPPVVPIRLYVEAVYSSLEISDVDTTLLDAYASFDWYLIPVVKVFGVQVGYRYYDLEAEDKEQGVKIDGKFQGPFAGIVLRF
jgi:hypothetical protein